MWTGTCFASTMNIETTEEPVVTEVSGVTPREESATEPQHVTQDATATTQSVEPDNNEPSTTEPAQQQQPTAVTDAATDPPNDRPTDGQAAAAGGNQDQAGTNEVDTQSSSTPSDDKKTDSPAGNTSMPSPTRLPASPSPRVSASTSTKGPNDTTELTTLPQPVRPPCTLY